MKSNQPATDTGVCQCFPSPQNFATAIPPPNNSRPDYPLKIPTRGSNLTLSDSISGRRLFLDTLCQLLLTHTEIACYFCFRLSLLKLEENAWALDAKQARRISMQKRGKFHFFCLWHCFVFFLVFWLARIDTSCDAGRIRNEKNNKQTKTSQKNAIARMSLSSRSVSPLAAACPNAQGREPFDRPSLTLLPSPCADCPPERAH